MKNSLEHRLERRVRTVMVLICMLWAVTLLLGPAPVSGAQANKPEDHIITAGPCVDCHKDPAEDDYTFYHGPGTADRCEICHDDRVASGKPASHLDFALPAPSRRSFEFLAAGLRHRSPETDFLALPHSGNIVFPRSSRNPHDASDLLASTNERHRAGVALV